VAFFVELGTGKFLKNRTLIPGDDELIPAEFNFYMKGNPSLEKAKEPSPFKWSGPKQWLFSGKKIIILTEH